MNEKPPEVKVTAGAKFPVWGVRRDIVEQISTTWGKYARCHPDAGGVCRKGREFVLQWATASLVDREA
jgi:hypothetical protein